MIYTLGFLWIFTIGGLTGLPLSTLATDVHLHDTYFVVAHFHYVMMGGVLFALITAILTGSQRLLEKCTRNGIEFGLFVSSFHST